MDEIALSRYGAASGEPSPVNRMMAQFASDFRDGVDINLGVGYVNERTIPEQAILEGLREVLADPVKYRQALNYGGPAGSQNLIDSIRAFHINHGIGGLTEDVLDRQAIIIGPSGATSILEGLADVLEPGIVITTDPMYYIYCNYLTRKGYEVVAVPEDGEGMDPEALVEAIKRLGDRRDQIRMVYVITVNNPSCTILSNARRAALVEMIAWLSRGMGRRIPVVFDKAYELLVHGPEVEPLESGLLHDDAGIVYEIGTLSKILAPALRIGYLMGPDGPLMRAMVQKTSDVGFSAPLIAQEIASYLLDHHAGEQIRRVNAGYREKAARVREALRGRLDNVIAECRGGQAGFYFYLTFDDVETAEDSRFFHYLARTTGQPGIDEPDGSKAPRVVYLPGEFCVHPEGALAAVGRRQLRVSYGFEEIERIEEAIGYMAEAAAYAREAAGTS